jgi:dipeptidyl aminopeptidase/acylaminoacyl peptidase
MLRHDRRFLHRSTYSQWRERVRGEEDFDEDAISPARQVRRLSRPVFLAQGRHDKVVPLRQFTLMVDAAKDAGVALETLVLDDTHHLEDPENEAEFLSALLDFLHRHNPAD